MSVRRLDSLLESQECLKPDVIKLDVEGAEAMVLEGATSLLSNHSPRLAIELHGAAVARQVLQILWGMNYRCFGPMRENESEVYKEITLEDLDKLTGLYSLHFLLASRNVSDLLPPLEIFSPQHSISN